MEKATYFYKNKKKKPSIKILTNGRHNFQNCQTDDLFSFFVQKRILYNSTKRLIKHSQLTPQGNTRSFPHKYNLRQLDVKHTQNGQQ